MKKILILIIFSFLFSVKAVLADAGYEVSPVIISEQASIRDILEYKLKFKNNLDRKIEIFAIRKDLTAENGEQFFQGTSESDKAASLSSWIEFTGGAVELMPGEEKETPLTIKVNPFAKPGKHYAKMIFSEAAHKNEAEENAKTLNLPELNISIDIKENIVEQTELVSFTTKKSIFFKNPIIFLSKLKNTGNVKIAPHGSVSIYNRKGQEVDVVDINSENQEIEAESEREFISNWGKSSFGKFKARLNVDYGVNRKSLQDSVYFWVIPARVLAVFSVGIFLLITVLSIIIFKKTHKHEEADDQEAKPVAKVSAAPTGGHVLDLKRK